MLDHLRHLLLGKRSNSKRGVYIVAAALPILVLAYSMSAFLYYPHNLTLVIDLWPLLLIATIPFVQFFYPTVVGWVVIVGMCGLALGELLFDLIDQLMFLYNVGPEGLDHGIFEGWDNFILEFGVAAILMLVLILIASNFPKVEIG